MTKRLNNNAKINILTKSDAIDFVLYAISIGTITSAALVAPNSLQMLDKPLNKLLDGLDDRQKRRKLSRLKSYMKTQGLIKNDYEHGLVLTEKSHIRLEKMEFDNITIQTSDVWDKKWHIVMFDIPEQKKYSRQLFTDKLKELGLQILQQSVWIHPYPCLEEIHKIASYFDVRDFVTYIETSHIDNEKKLIYRFKQTVIL